MFILIVSNRDAIYEPLQMHCSLQQVSREQSLQLRRSVIGASYILETLRQQSLGRCLVKPLLRKGG